MENKEYAKLILKVRALIQGALYYNKHDMSIQEADEYVDERINQLIDDDSDMPF